MRIHENNKKNGEERPQQDWRDKVKMADAYVDFKEQFIEILSEFVLM